MTQTTNNSLISGARKHLAITPDDDAEFEVVRAIYVGTQGDLVVSTVEDADTPFTYVGALGFIPVRAIKVWEASSAEDILGLY